MEEVTVGLVTGVVTGVGVTVSLTVPFRSAGVIGPMGSLLRPRPKE